MRAHSRAERLVEAIDRAERKARPTCAQDQWGDYHMQTVEAAGLEKTRERIGTTFNQHAAEPTLGKAG